MLEVRSLVLHEENGTRREADYGVILDLSQSRHVVLGLISDGQVFFVKWQLQVLSCGRNVGIDESEVLCMLSKLTQPGLRR